MELIPGSIEWYQRHVPYGVSVNEELTWNTNRGIHLNIDASIYPTKMDQMGIINYIELAMTEPGLQIVYFIDGGQSVMEYLTAYEFREANGYDVANKFFEPIEAKHFGKRLEDICQEYSREE